ncbi:MULTISPECIES: SDR family NAD(P)-dependent oxidoreductase [unclassified Arcicella]|uniref:SDR family NAD(P)-dependent oxidoreductase n=1 Tax=unclassified Arcicella TaxID=2644986 RepID=UPI00285FA96B|nr:MULTISPECIES: SDR family NAD(P)-dependent oxidoreductase [unclassified Arcicella]MDR6564769.1 NADP-dependent 3-hydroxy acid dehydrogenase YdfG [Arcicella sp. BE51]MDR6814565.1 NADP-dependent 3-hydroxy acid dehydrogenase YdfG [Arcicella sp. BE140]MDR6825943.1 NADP-dependent 3-hydroxy acid dehydrogenase YdfG [Arcicella sp. BE139]
MSKLALITGASSGIGKATAEAFAELGINLIICGRRIEKLEALKESLSGKVDVQILTFDVRDKEQVESALNSLSETAKNIDILVNNAGNAHGMGPIQDGSTDDWDAMIDGNVKGLLYVSRVIMPWMKARKQGHIVNLSSIAGKSTYPNGNVYCASKAAVEAISEGMRLDLNPFGIKVTNVAPGAVETEFSMVRFKGDEQKADAIYKGFEPLKAEDIADIIAFAVTRPAHVVMADITLFPVAQASATVINREALK